MTRVEYELLRDERPDLKLLTWAMMGQQNQLNVANHTRDTLTAFFSAKILQDGHRNPAVWISSFEVPKQEVCPYCNPYREAGFTGNPSCWACKGSGLWKDAAATLLAES